MLSVRLDSGSKWLTVTGSDCEILSSMFVGFIGWFEGTQSRLMVLTVVNVCSSLTDKVRVPGLFSTMGHVELNYSCKIFCNFCG